MAYTNNKFCWYGILSTDVDRAGAFYPEVLGWKSTKVPMGDEEATMMENAGKNILHLAEPAMAGMPSHWNQYLKVDDVDKKLAAAVENGGKEIMPPTDIPPGRFAVVAAPSGATFSLFKESGSDAEDARDGVGEIHWTELHSKDVDSDLTWLKKSFGYTTEEMPMPDGPYFILKDGDVTAGGVMAGMNPQAPSMWLSWVHVENVEETLARVKSNGGNAHTDVMEVPNVGRMAVVADPTGGVFGIITPPTVS